METLLQRDSPFGNLKLWEIKESYEGIFQRLLQVEAIDTLEITATRMTPRFIQKLLSAASKGVKFDFEVRNSLGLDWSTVDIRPKELAVTFTWWDSDAYLDFVASFLRRVAELGDFVKLEVDLFYLGRLPDSLNKELIRAIEANRSLAELKLGRNFVQCAEQFKDILSMMEYHEGLRLFTSPAYESYVDPYKLYVDPDYSMLKQLLKRNRFIEVTDWIGDLVTDGDEIDRLYSFNRFFRGLRALTKEPFSLLPPLVGEALIHSASGDFRRSALVLANHTFALCELVQHSSHNAQEASSFSFR